MTTFRFTSNSALRATSALVLASMLVPLAGCGSNAPTTTASAPPPGVGSQQANSRPSLGVNNKQKAVLLAGAAALFYYYQKSKKANEAKFGTPVQYYRSKNGGIYYRDPKSKAAIFVTAPSPNYQVQVPQDELASYGGIQQAQGYNGQRTGNGLDFYYPAPAGG